MMKEWDLLCDRIASMERVAVSFSGGVDSTVILAAAVKALPEDHIAVFADVPMLSERQRLTAIAVADELKANVVVAKLCWHGMPGVRENTAERCYHCKKAIYSAVRCVALDNGFTVCADGENSSDNADERPGRRAASELGMISPLKDLGFTREIVKKMFGSLRLRTDVQKETCLATRFPLGVPFGDEDLRLIEECEETIRKISGVRLIRMRLLKYGAELFALPSEVSMLAACSRELSDALLSKGISKMTINEKGYRE